ncbi:MAG: ATPase [Gammaproteobacteria bacterium RIFCSPHIGHO2_12_FULL_38_11]|nr:MAG: ATPase [Gammaproteobacteria bacterium RIFCSPHIGHO2_12_FULL_38_11]
MSESFVGRSKELRELKQIQERESANLVVVQGRRRIGKSRLIEEFAKDQKFYCFIGTAPTKKTTAQMQMDEFARQLCEQFSLPKFAMQDWGDLLTMLYKQVSKNRVVILFDEISWMGSLDATFLGKLKNAWDTQFKKNPKLMLVLCGSVSSWIEENIISSTLFLGRPTLYLTLHALPLPECNQFLKAQHSHISPYEKLKLLSVTGGVPRYLELININLSAEDNIRAMCFSPNAPLLNEFERIFSDIFGTRSKIYKEIIQLLAKGSVSLEDIFENCGRTKTGDFSVYLNDLETAGFVSRDFTWNLNNNKQSKLSHYRLKDNYVRFYLKYIAPNKTKIAKGLFNENSITTLPAWESILGLQFQNLVLNNAIEIIKKLEIPLEDVQFVNSFFQQKTKSQPGCQIDLLIQTKYNCLFVCEIKFSKNKIPVSIIDEVQKKITSIKMPKNVSCRPVLIHVNGVAPAVLEKRYFSRVIDFGEILVE